MAAQILPEPEGKETDNSYFREGSRSLISIGIIFEIMIDLYHATLSSVALLLENRQRLEDMARYIAGVTLDGKQHPDGPFPVSYTHLDVYKRQGHIPAVNGHLRVHRCRS